MPTIGITGAAGFLGSSLIRCLSARESCQIQAMDRVMPSDESLKAKSVQWRLADLNSEADCQDFVRDAEVILHLAHANTPLTSNRHLPSDASLNLLPTLNLLEAIRRVERKPHFIYASSGGAVYGASFNRQPFKESDVCHPVTSYGIQKLMVEHYVRMAAQEGWLRGTCLRIGNPYGVLLPPERKQGLIGVMFSHLIRQQPVPVFGDPTNVRDYIHLDDLCSFFQKVILGAWQFEVFNVGSGQGHSVRDILDILESLLGRQIELAHVSSLPEADKLVPWIVLNIEKSDRLLGWRPRFPIREGLATMCSNCRNDLKQGHTT